MGNTGTLEEIFNWAKEAKLDFEIDLLLASCDHTVDPQIGQGTTDQAAYKRHILYRQKRYTQQMYFKMNCQHELVTLQHCQQNTEMR